MVEILQIRMAFIFQGQLVRRRVWRIFHLVKQDGRRRELCTGELVVAGYSFIHLSMFQVPV